MCYTLPTLPYTALPWVIISLNNLQAPVKFAVNRENQSELSLESVERVGEAGFAILAISV